MREFFRFPHTPHLSWLGSGTPRDDKVLTSAEADALLADEVVVEEKLDGANVGISLGPDGALRFQNRGQYLHPPYVGQFQRLDAWTAQHQDRLCGALTDDHQLLFGEWCAARHSVQYDRLPDWFIVFDLFDRRENKFASTRRRDVFAERVGLAVVSELQRGRTTLAALKLRLIQERSRYRTGPVEGFVIRRETVDWLTARAKLVHPDFVQSIGEHWRRRRIEWNRLDHSQSEMTNHESQR
jgi:ATP-dependent RNA circularization protein (DNA/RNA ligase family)